MLLADEGRRNENACTRALPTIDGQMKCGCLALGAGAIRTVASGREVRHDGVGASIRTLGERSS